MTAKPAIPAAALRDLLAQERRPIRDRHIDSLLEARRAAPRNPGRRVTQFWSFLESPADKAPDLPRT